MNSEELEKYADSFLNIFYKGCCKKDMQYPIRYLSIQESYNVQDMVTKRKIAKGESEIGYKVGCTSHAIRSQFGLNEPISGRLFWPHVFNDMKELDLKNYTNCAIEPEMVFRIGRDLKGENLPDLTLINAIEYVSPGIEIHNYKFWYPPPTLQELICSNGIHAGLIIGGNKISPEKLSFVSEWFKVYKDDKGDFKSTSI